MLKGPEMLKLLACLLALTIGVAHVAAQQAPPTPEVYALQVRVNQEINANLQCNAAAFSLQQQLAAAQTEIKALKEKYEPEAKK